MLGEYAALALKPAVIATLGPRFTLQVGQAGQAAATSFAPASPAGKLVAHAQSLRVQVPELQFTDPYQGRGGFGASTAQFALVYWALAEAAGWPRDWSRAWSLYRELTRPAAGETVVPPSGADLVAQWQGGIGRVLPTSSWTDLGVMIEWSCLHVFSATEQAGRKVATHEHLAKLAQSGFPDACPDVIEELEKPLHYGLERIQRGDLEGLGRAMNGYADVLRQVGYECDATFSDRQALSQLPGVLGVKGAGALQADAVLVLVSSELEDARPILAAAEARGLRLVARGLDLQDGIR